MATYTQKLNLIKPAGDDFVDIGELNQNSDILDDKLGNHIGAGASAHKIATATEAGFMSPALYAVINNIRVIPFSVFYDTIKSPTEEIGKTAEQTGEFVTPKSLFYNWQIDSNKHLNTLKVSFDARSITNASKTLYVYTTNDDTNVYVNDVHVGKVSSQNRGLITLGNWNIGEVKRVKIYSNNTTADSWFTIGSLKNCEVA